MRTFIGYSILVLLFLSVAFVPMILTGRWWGGFIVIGSASVIIAIIVLAVDLTL